MEMSQGNGREHVLFQHKKIKKIKKMKFKKKTWDDVSLEQFRNIKSLYDEKRAAEDETVGLLSILYGKDEDEILNLSISQFSEMVGSIDFLYTRIEPRDIQERYDLNGRNYEICTLNNFTYQQYMNYQLIVKEKDRDYLDILSLILVEKGKKYGETDTEKVKADILTMCIRDVLAIDFFFLLSYRILTETFRSYADRMTKKALKMKKRAEMKKKIKALLSINGCGRQT